MSLSALVDDSATSEDQAAAAIRAYCNWHIAPIVTETLIVDGSGTNVQLLPTLHIVSVASVLEDSVPLVAGASYDWRASGVLTRAGTLVFGSGYAWTSKPRGVSVTLTHGYETCPADLAGVATDLAGRISIGVGGAVAAGPFSMSGASWDVSRIFAAGSYQADVLNKYRIPNLSRAFISTYGEPVTFDRDGSPVADLRGMFDPADNRLYLDHPADVTAADVAGLRGMVRRVIEPPLVYLNGPIAGVVVQLEAAPPLLPDLGRLSRPNDTIAYDRATNTVVSETDPLWTGPCLVEPTLSQGAAGAVSEQVVGVQRFTVTVPSSLEDVKPDDLFEVTQSRDGRLTTSQLQVTAVAASSSSLVRVIQAVENQG